MKKILYIDVDTEEIIRINLSPGPIIAQDLKIELLTYAKGILKIYVKRSKQ